jgi:16S rRNA processing protein RimM
MGGYIAIGRVERPWGIKGEVKVKILTDFPERFSLLKRVYLGDEAIPFALEGFRLHKGRALLKLKGCDDRSSAEKLRGKLVQIPIEEAMPLGEDEYYVHQIVGLIVWTKDGELLGRVKEVLFTGSNEVYVVEGDDKEILIPAIEEVVVEVDIEGGRMIVNLMEGLR